VFIVIRYEPINWHVFISFLKQEACPKAG